MGEEIQMLEGEYCPPVDPALVHAIYSDYAHTPDGIQLARGLLDSIKQSALQEQFTDFDPSGSSGDAVRDGQSKHSSSEVESNAESWVLQSTMTEYTNVSNALSTLSLEGNSSSGSEESLGGGYFKDTEQFDTPTKEALLAETFPTLRPDLIAFTLKKCNDDFGKATDELLNHVYFEDSRSSPGEEPVVAKGIDAFAEERHLPQRGKKGKGKGKQKLSLLYNTSSASASESDLNAQVPTNKWHDGSRDVEFIASRMKLSPKTVASMYHKNGASLPATIMAMVQLDVAANQKRWEPDPAILQGAIELSSDFPSVELETAMALIRLTAPSTASAHELAKALTTAGVRTFIPQGGIQLIPRYAPILLSDPTPTSPTFPALPPSAPTQTTASLSAARDEAFTKASTAYRKGKSAPLMKAVAGYYSQVGRDLNANVKAMNESDADALVDSQSSSTKLDLHGVSVHSATRIARERVRAWWDGLGEDRIPGGGRRGVGEGYRIVIGLGRHSEGGRGRIGPAVVKALVKEGWKVEVGSGVLVVMGLARRK
ncbi:hypothetical protein K469DRAFT_744815 [Zopfia rhizophila CBS 207.26]|uniref:Smr domain-containing protein n=1 Tax=Zopfia rhizophila CBS 207.26 TaxID=1314779 RepID=A0A6A6ESU6_9PEZI|nr:hypothetical protein K469DRAFT_744815 [Zopfia rhizophila CBS 207.26]